MKKTLIFLILISVGSIYAQTDDKESLKALNQKISTAYKKGDFGDAAKFAKQAIEMTEKLYGSEDRQTAIAYENLGLIYQEDKKYKLSAENLRKTVEIYEKNEKKNGADLINAYEKLALSQYLAESLKEAEASQLRSFEIAETNFGKDGKETFQPVLSLANFYAKTENLEKSRENYLKSYALALKYFGRESGEFDSVNMFESYFSAVPFWTNDERYKEYKGKKSEILGYETGDAVSFPRPEYPAAARRVGKKGKIVVKVWINEKGEVTNSKAVLGEMFFAPQVEQAAKYAKFKPAIQNGKPINTTGFIAYKFQ